MSKIYFQKLIMSDYEEDVNKLERSYSPGENAK